MARLTTIERKMYNILVDGDLHSRKELHDCLYEDMSPLQNIKAHVCNLRKKLEARGLEIICRKTTHGYYYRMVRFLASAIDGKK